MFTNVLTFVIFNETLKINPTSTTVNREGLPRPGMVFYFISDIAHMLTKGLCCEAYCILLLRGQQWCLHFVPQGAARHLKWHSTVLCL